MRAVIQRVSRASVAIEGNLVSEIPAGLLILLAVEDSDAEEDIRWLSGKIARLRIFTDSEGLMNRSILEVKGEIMVVSQFTLFASTKKGNRPSYVRSAKPNIAIPLYERFVKQMSADLGAAVKTGEFGAMMHLTLVNDGPVTIFIDTKNRE